ncbi:MAG TPA: hypothetical protein VG496_14695 [Myxococcales bacterium]|nr:hypothetical protein [Myxococcales bacterium]
MESAPVESASGRTVALATGAATAIAALFSFMPVFDTDVGWHVAVGRLILAGRFPRTNALSWTAPDHPWYPTSWLFDVLSALAADFLPGTLGLQILTLAFLAAFAYLLARACVREDPHFGAWIAPAVTVLLVPRIVPRPHITAWAALAAVLWLGPLSTRARGIAVCVVAFAGNLHSGAAFAAGALGLYCLEAFHRSRRRVELALALACGAALLLNPGATFNLRYLYDHLHVQEVVRLVEFDRPTLASQPAFFVLLPIAVALAAWRARERPALFAATLVFAGLSLRAARMTFEFEIVAAPTFASALLELRRRHGVRAAALATVLFAIGCAASRRADQWAATLRLGPRWNERLVPVRVAEFVRQNGLSGPHFNSFSDGGYLEYALPALPAFLDARVQAYPVELLRELQEAERSRPSFDAFLRARGAEWAITTRIRERLGGFRLLDQPGWALVYWDGIDEVWLRRDVPRFKPLIDSLEYRHFRPYGSIVGTVAQLPAGELRQLWEEIDRYEKTSRGDPFALIVRCGAARRLELSDAAQVCQTASVVAPSPEARLLALKAAALHP